MKRFSLLLAALTLSACRAILPTPHRPPVEPPTRQVEIQVVDGAQKPLQGVTVTIEAGDFKRDYRDVGDPEGHAGFGEIPNCQIAAFTIEASKPGYMTHKAGPFREGYCGNFKREEAIVIALVERPTPPPVIVTWPPALPRSALPPHNASTIEAPNADTAPSLHPVFTDPPDPPSRPLVRFWRGDAWAVTVPGLVPVPGGAAGGTPAESRVLTYFLGRYERARAGSEAQILAAHRAAGYTHFSLSPQDEFAQGMSEDGYVAMTQRVRAAGFYDHHLLLSKYYTDRDNPDLSQTMRLLDRILPAGPCDVEALPGTARACPVITPAWEGNFMEPEVLLRVILAIAGKVGDRGRVMLHFFPHYIAWQIDGTAPGPWWNQLIDAGVDGVLYQGDPSWTMGMLSARLQDAQNRLSTGGAWGVKKDLDLVIWEDQATNQYNNGRTGNGRLADEAEGNLRGLEAVSTPGLMPIMGAGNGIRRMSGAAY